MVLLFHTLLAETQPRQIGISLNSTSALRLGFPGHGKKSIVVSDV